MKHLMMYRLELCTVVHVVGKSFQDNFREKYHLVMYLVHVVTNNNIFIFPDTHPPPPGILGLKATLKDGTISTLHRVWVGEGDSRH